MRFSNIALVSVFVNRSLFLNGIVCSAGDGQSPAVTIDNVARAKALKQLHPTLEQPCTDTLDNSCAVDPSTVDLNQECGVWMAPSTIKGAGMGMFAGRSFLPGDDLLPSGDIVIPILDLTFHHDFDNEESKFLWDEYTWNADALLMDHEAEDVDVASPGYGAAANCFLDLVNVEEHNPTSVGGDAGLHRSTDPGAGAFTAYHERRSTAKSSIQEGQEFFVSYGDYWFESRSYKMGQLPLTGDHPIANSILRRYKVLKNRYGDRMPRVIEAVQDKFLLNKPIDSHTLNAIPSTEMELDTALDVGLVEMKREQSIVSVEWLQQYGSCADNIKAGRSTIRQAGRGAFATRLIPKGSVVAPVPLIHLVDGRQQMEMYELEEETFQIKNHSRIVQKQLLLNYCFGHTESSLLLSPYGSMTSLVNHNQTLANVRLRWGDEQKTNHDPVWLNKTLKELNNISSAVLSMEFVATRDIIPGEEILMDYGDEWEAAWNHHVSTWTHHRSGNNMNIYRSAQDLNDDKNSIVQLLEHKDAYPDNIVLKCYTAFAERNSLWKRLNVSSRTQKDFLVQVKSSEVSNCEVTSWKYSKIDQEAIFDAKLIEEDGTVTTIDGVPREAFVFFDKPYTSDMHLPNAFRHEMVIPSDLFPEHWKNKNIRGGVRK